MQLINMPGIVIKQEKIQTGALKQTRHQINVAGVSSGSYILIIMDEKGNRQTQKVIIAH